MTRSVLPEAPGVYLITKIQDDIEIPYYIGRTKNIRQRLYNNHLKGPFRSAPLKKYLVHNQICLTEGEARDFILKHCAARWLQEEDYRRRGALESFWTSILFPQYGIDEEH